MRVFAILFTTATLAKEMVSVVDEDRFSVAKDKRYLLYDVNHGEGFNLRRDVYMRVANTVRILREKGENFILVLPPWGGLYHWQNQELRVPWSRFFDLKSLNDFVPVMEFEEFLSEHPSPIENVAYLQHFAEGWGGDGWKEKFAFRECNGGNKYYKEDGELWKGWFFTYDEVRAKKFQCISIQGDSNTLANLILEKFKDSNSIFVDRAETILHERYGEKHYWQARRSMRYAKHLLKYAEEFRANKLNSADDIHLPDSWLDESPSRQTSGGDYICAHWRRRDFLRAHGKELPDIAETARQLNAHVKREGVWKVFLATDAEKAEVKELRGLLDVELVRLEDNEFSDGELAIIDQIICSRARYFTGSHVSTFSYRIQEDREIMGFPAASTFNRMCPKAEPDCEQPAKWMIVY